MHLLSDEQVVMILFLGFVSSSLATIHLGAFFKSNSQESILEPIESLIFVGDCARSYFGIQGLFQAFQESGFNCGTVGQCSHVVVYFCVIRH